MCSMQRYFKVIQGFVRGTSNLLVERTSVVVFKIYVFFVSLKEQIPNKSVSEILESIPLKIFSILLRILLRKIDLSTKKCVQRRR